MVKNKTQNFFAKSSAQVPSPQLRLTNREKQEHRNLCSLKVFENSQNDQLGKGRQNDQLGKGHQNDQLGKGIPKMTS